MIITEVYDIVSKEKTKEVLGSQNIPNPSGKEEKGYTTSWGGSTGGSGNGNGSGHNYRSACIYEWEQGA